MPEAHTPTIEDRPASEVGETLFWPLIQNPPERAYMFKASSRPRKPCGSVGHGSAAFKYVNVGVYMESDGDEGFRILGFGINSDNSKNSSFVRPITGKKNEPHFYCAGAGRGLRYCPADEICDPSKQGTEYFFYSENSDQDFVDVVNGSEGCYTTFKRISLSPL